MHNKVRMQICMSIYMHACMYVYMLHTHLHTHTHTHTCAGDVADSHMCLPNGPSNGHVTLITTPVNNSMAKNSNSTSVVAAPKKARDVPNGGNLPYCANMPWEEGSAGLSTSSRGIVDLVRDMC